MMKCICLLCRHVSSTGVCGLCSVWASVCVPRWWRSPWRWDTGPCHTLPHIATHCHTLPATRDKTAQPQSPIDWPPYLVHQVERRLGLETSQAITAIRQDPAWTVFLCRRNLSLSSYLFNMFIHRVHLKSTNI